MNKLYLFKFLVLCCILLSSFCVALGQNDSLSVNGDNIANDLPKAQEAFPVAPFRDTLFYINSNLGSFSSQERAASTTEKIRYVSKVSDGFQADSMNVVMSEGIANIVFRNTVVMSVTATDAKLQGKKPYDLATVYEKKIIDAVAQHEKDSGWLTLLFRVFLVVLIAVVQYFLIKVVNRLFGKISNKVEQLKGKKIKTIKFKSYKLMDEEKSTKFILFLIRILRYLLIGLMLYLSIPLAFSIFPATRDIATALFGYVLTPFKKIFTAIIGFIPNLIAIVIIIFVFKYLIRGLRFLAEEIGSERLTVKGFYPDWALPTFNIVKTLLYAFMFVVLFPYLPGSDSDVFKGVSVFIGIVFSLGSSSIISNVVSGLVLTYMRPFKVGDRIKIGDIVGNVVEKTPFVTRIRTPKNEEVTIPNSNIMSAQTFNYTHSATTYGLILHTEVTIGYDAPWRQIHELLLGAAQRTPDLLEQPKPFILQTALNDFYVEYQLNVYIRDADKMAHIYSGLHQNIQDMFNEAGVEIMSPHYQAHRDGSQTTIPATYLPEDYQAPPFHVRMEK